MKNCCFVTGTDTDVGKTVVCSWLTLLLKADYWKPVQAGREDGTDTERVAALTGLAAERLHPSAYSFDAAVAPHEAARRERVSIDFERLARPPATDRFLVIEGAGGLLVPLDQRRFVIDLIAQLEAPVILVARSTLGTINHTLLSLEALRQRAIPVLGVVLNGPDVPHNLTAIEQYGGVRVLGQIPPLDPLSQRTLEDIEPRIDPFLWGNLL